MYWLLTETYVLNAIILVFMLIHTESFSNVSGLGLGLIYCGLGLEIFMGASASVLASCPVGLVNITAVSVRVRVSCRSGVSGDGAGALISNTVPSKTARYVGTHLSNVCKVKPLHRCRGVSYSAAVEGTHRYRRVWVRSNGNSARDKYFTN